MFEWLFNYPLSAWKEASLAFERPWPISLGLVALLLVLITIAISVWRQPVSLARRLMVVSLQSFVACLVLLMLWQPVLKREVAEAGENTVAWVLDASASMQIQDVAGSSVSSDSMITRTEAGANIIEEFATSDNTEFQAELYANSDVLQALDSVDELESVPFSNSTRLATALDEILGTVNQTAIAAVVLISDGSDNSSAVDAQWWQRLSSAGVPVHTIGLGQLSHPDDIQLNDVTVPASAAAGVQLSATISVLHSTGGSARVRVLSGRDLIAAEDIDLPDDVQQSQHEISLPSGQPGVHQLQFDLARNEAPLDPDLNNNRQQRVIRVASEPRRILYVEGEPRWEFKFLRRALNGNPSVEIVSLLRTSPNKFYRQGVRDASELADGFPASRQALFEYDAIIIGSLEAAELSTAQQLALRDFVSVRGGALLMLGGRHGLADGGWGRSVVAAALPTVLDARLSANTFERSRAQVQPTLSGYRTPWLQLASNVQENRLAWQGLPHVADIQTVGTVKPGAVVYLEQSAVDADGEAQALLVGQRYGKGQSYVLGTSGSWRWQMGLDSTDQRHELFWTQLASHLVADVLPRIHVSSSEPIYRDNDKAYVSLLAFSPDFMPLQQATFEVQMTLPDGSTQNVQFKADTQQAGRYHSEVDMPMDGPYAIEAQTPLGGESPQGPLGRSETWWVRESGTAESFNSTQQQSFLQRIADVTGGSYLSYANAESVVNSLSEENAALKREIHLPLWNMPILFLGLILGKLAEWFLRLRWKRL